MAQYKVLQDIEAEDKLLGPLSLRQFIYAAITVGLGFVAFRLFVTNVWFLGFVFLPPALFFGLLAAPLGGQQSSEIWLLAKIRFFLLPRKRIWDQTGMLNLVTITAPKKVEKQLTKGYSQDEVKSRLKTLATTLDTRGWAVKNVMSNAYALPNSGSERLLDISAQDAPTIYVEPTADMLDPTTNPRAQNMDALIQKASLEHKEAIQKNIEHAKQAYAPQQARAFPSPHISTEDENKLLERVHKQESAFKMSQSHLKHIDPATATTPKTAMTPKADPAIMNIVRNSEGLSVQTTAGLANRAKQQDDDEVVISLH